MSDFLGHTMRYVIKRGLRTVQYRYINTTISALCSHGMRGDASTWFDSISSALTIVFIYCSLTYIISNDAF